MAARGLSAGDKVRYYFPVFGAKSAAWRRSFVVVEYEIPQGCAATYFPETNVLVAVDDVADKSNTPVSKSVKIRVALHEEGME